MDRGAGSFRDSLMRAFDEGRMDELVLMLANRLRSRQQYVSPHARAALPVDDQIFNPIRNTLLTPEEIETFGIHDRGWHLIAIRDRKIVGAERFPFKADDPNHKRNVVECMTTLLRYYGDDALVFAAYHDKGMLVEWQFLNEFSPQCRGY